MSELVGRLRETVDEEDSALGVIGRGGRGVEDSNFGRQMVLVVSDLRCRGRHFEWC